MSALMFATLLFLFSVLALLLLQVGVCGAYNLLLRLKWARNLSLRLRDWNSYAFLVRLVRIFKSGCG